MLKAPTELRLLLLIPLLSVSGLALANEEIEGGSPNAFEDGMGRRAVLEFSWEPEASLDVGGDLGFMEVDAALPVWGGRLSESWRYGFRLNYKASGFTLPEIVPIDEDTLHRLDFRAALIWRPENSPWSGFLSGGPALSADGASMDEDALLWTAILGIGYRFSDSFTLLAGGYFSQDFGEPRLIGSPGFIWTPARQWSASLIGPRLRIAFAPSEKWRIALEAKPDGGRWSVRTTDDEQAYLDRSTARAGLRVERRFAENGWLFAGGGWTFSRELRAEDGGGQELFDSDVDDGIYFSTGLTWRF